jgi:hypothetical protein
LDWRSIWISWLGWVSSSWLGWIGVGVISWWLGGSNLSPFAFTLEGSVIASLFVDESIASSHVTLVISLDRDASELDISDWWLSWVSIWISWLGWVSVSIISWWLAVSFVPHALLNTSDFLLSASSILLLNTFEEGCSILLNSNWSAEIVWWDFFCSRPDTVLGFLTSLLVVKLHYQLACEESKNCVWSTAKEIPPHDFCGPITLEKDATTFLKCIEQD